MEDWETDIADLLAILERSDARRIDDDELATRVVHRIRASVITRDLIEPETTHPNQEEPKPAPPKPGNGKPPVKGPISPIPRPKR